MFQIRMRNEIFTLVEVSYATFTLSSTSGLAIATQNVQFLQGSPAGGNGPASFVPGDYLELFPSAAVGSLGGVIVQAIPVPGTPGLCTIAVKNCNTGTPVTPSAGLWTLVASRIAANVT
jgi:hypothetical protein